MYKNRIVYSNMFLPLTPQELDRKEKSLVQRMEKKKRGYPNLDGEREKKVDGKLGGFFFALRSGIGIDAAVGAERGAGRDEGAAGDHEVGVALDEGVGGIVVEGVHDRGQELADLLVAGALDGELGDPDRLVVAGLMDLLQVGQEVVGVGAVVPVGGAEVEGALAVAGGDPLLEPVDALVLGAAVGDGGGRQCWPCPGRGSAGRCAAGRRWRGRGCTGRGCRTR